MKCNPCLMVSPKMSHQTVCTGLKTLNSWRSSFMAGRSRKGARQRRCRQRVDKVRARSRYGVVATAGEGMTTGYAARSEPAPARPTVFLDRLVSVLGAGRVVPALAADHVGKRMLVGADQDQDGAGHRPEGARRSSSARASASTAAKGSSTAAGRAIRITSYGIP